MKPKRAKPVNEYEWTGIVYPPVGDKDLADAIETDVDQWIEDKQPIITEGNLDELC